MIDFLEINRSANKITCDYQNNQIIIDDTDFMEFITKTNGGYFFNNSLHFYGYSKTRNYHDLHYMNDLFKINYGEIVMGLVFIAEDIFGNSFVFENGRIFLFNIESGQKECLSNDFSNFINTLKNDLEYLTGLSIANELTKEENIKLSEGNRLAPKYPFILGGNYDISNLYLKNFKKNIEFNSSIAKQIINLPDGSKIDFEIE